MRFKDEVAVLNLRGRFLAGSDGPYLRQKVKDLIDAGTTKLVVDFADVPYIDSTGLGFLAGARVTVQNAGARLILSKINPHIRKILEELNLTHFFAIAENEEAAIAMLHQPPSPAEVSSGPPKRESKSKKRTTPETEA